MELNRIYTSDNLQMLKTFPDNSIDLIVTSPNYNNWRNKRTDKSKEMIRILMCCLFLIT